MLLRNLRAKSDPYISKIIIDTHGGLDDVIAILQAINLAKFYKVDIIGITVTNGRRSLQDAADDALLAVILAKKQIPIYSGSKQSLMLNQKYPKCINFSEDHSQLDKIKQTILTVQHKKLIQTVPASKFLADSAKKYHQSLGMLCFGPLTNMALASHMTQQIKSIGILYVTGGQHSATSNVLGKHSQQGNFSYDPQAAHFVFKTFRKSNINTNLYVNPIQTSLTFNFQSIITQYLESHSLKLSTPIKSLYTSWMNIHKEYTINPSLLTTVLMFNPRILKKFYQVYAEICVEGKEIKGLMAIDWLRMEIKNNQRQENVKEYHTYYYPLSMIYLTAEINIKFKKLRIQAFKHNQP